jgi:serine/threonine protein kinase
MEFDSDYMDLINGMLSNDEDFRMTIKEVLEHPWMKKEVMEEEERIEIMNKYKEKITRKRE